MFELKVNLFITAILHTSVNHFLNFLFTNIVTWNLTNCSQSLNTRARVGISTHPIYSSVVQKLNSQHPNPIRIGPAAMTGPIRMLHDEFVSISARRSVRTPFLTRVKMLDLERRMNGVEQISLVQLMFFEVRNLWYI